MWPIAKQMVQYTLRKLAIGKMYGGRPKQTNYGCGYFRPNVWKATAVAKCANEMFQEAFKVWLQKLMGAKGRSPEPG